MTKKKYFVLLAAAALFAGCSKSEPAQEDNPTKVESISVSPAALSFEASGGEQSISVTATSSWKAETDASSSSWLTLTPASDGKSLKVAAAAHEDYNASREASIKLSLSSDSTKSKSVSVSQKAAEAPVVSASLMSAKWEVTSSYATSCESAWTSTNKFCANNGTGASKAYVSTEGAAVLRSKNGNNISVSNLTTGDAIVFTWPNVSVAAGSTVDFMVSLYSPTGLAPKYWIFEYYTPDGWKSVDEDLRSAKEDASLKYSFKLYYDDTQYASFVQSFPVESALNGDLKMRVRAVGAYNTAGGALSANSTAYVGFVNSRWCACTVNVYQGVPVKDSKNVLVLGNSFTYYYGTNYFLKEIARSQGHEMRMRTFAKGSQYFRQHATLEMSLEQTNCGGFDYAVLQDQSGQHARYAYDKVANASVLTETKSFTDLVRQSSPSVNILLENTWAFLGSSNYEGYGSMERFDALLQTGAKEVAEGSLCTVSPIGVAFQKAREEGLTDLYYTDNKHPSRNGSYLKSCVNYLMIYGQKFDSNAPDCELSATTAAKLRTVAEQVVLEGWKPSYFILNDPQGTSFGVKGGSGEVTFLSNVSYEASSNQSWCKVTKGDGLLGWSVDESTLADSRTATITISPSGLAAKTITITQSGTSTASNGISTPEELIDFASRVNSSSDYSQYCNGEGEVILKNDIDMTGKQWTPIGMPSVALSLEYNSIPEPTDHPFKGVFNGCGYTIRNLSMGVDIQSTQFCGLFATCSGATIKNLKMEGACLSYSGSGISASHADIALLVGYLYGGKVSGVEVSGTVTGSASSTQSRQVGVGGIIGAMGNSAVVENCSFDGSIDATIEEKYSNNNTTNVGGIAALVLYKKGSGGNSKIVGCTNNATITAKSHRAAGIVSSMFYTDIESCTNNGDITCNYAPGAISSKGTTIKGVRMGGIMGYCSMKTEGSSVTLCLNTGTIKTSEAESVTGGAIGLVKCMKISDCSNCGNVIGPESAGRGLLVGIAQATTTPTSFFACKLKGSIGSSEESLVAATRENFLNQGIGITIVSGVSCPTWDQEYVSFWE